MNKTCQRRPWKYSHWFRQMNIDDRNAIVITCIGINVKPVEVKIHYCKTLKHCKEVIVGFSQVDV